MLENGAASAHPKMMLSKNSRGRIKKLESDHHRTEYVRDVHRIIYSQPFRRLKHKTQVFFLPKNDHICTRLEHVLLVSSASRTIAHHLGLNEDLVEAISLAHDFGHAPFGHHGETVLKKISDEADLNMPFQHEVHGLRVVDRLAELDREPDAGLNLTYEVRDGIISHCGEDFKNHAIKPHEGYKELESIKDRKSAGMPVTMEGCVVRMVDKIAYAGRDVEDALTAGLIKEGEIPKEIVGELGNNNGKIVGVLIKDLIDYSKEHEDSIGFSEEKHAVLNRLIKFNYDRIYNHDDVKKYKKQAEAAIRNLYEHLLKCMGETERFKRETDRLPETAVYGTLKTYIGKIGYSESDKNEMIVLDFISGMTDNYVVECLGEIYTPKCIT